MRSFIALSSPMDPLSIKASVARYEAFLRQALGNDLVKDDLDEKHTKMRKSPFQFLRATCWRWAETAPLLCPDLAEAPNVLAIGDAHIENFGSGTMRRDASSGAPMISTRPHKRLTPTISCA